jgi:mRNA-degrading endonuclease toxin of MazEF toxin-antitoxin module
LRRGEIYRTSDRIPERGGKPGYYLVVSRDFIAAHEDIATVVCAPVYGKVLGLSTELVLNPEDGVARRSAARCDFLTLMFKERLTHLTGRIPRERVPELDRALAVALDLSPDG